MALRFLDSFDHYNDFTEKYNTVISAPTFVTGRFGNGAQMFSPSAGTGHALRKTLDAQANWVIGAAYMLDKIPNGNVAIFSCFDGATTHAQLMINTSGQLVVTRAGTVLATGTTVLSINVWYYLEFKVLIADAGTFDVHINGVDEAALNGSGDTRNAGNASANIIQFGPNAISNGGNHTFDDIYVCDTTGGVNDTFLGDLRVEALFPNGNGNSSQWVGSDADSTDNYLLVDETTDPNDDTDYVESSTVGNKDTYAYTNLTTTSGTVYGVQVIPWARKTDAGTRSICSIARLSGTEVDSADKALSVTYQYLPDCRDTKPGGGSWSISDVNSSEFGEKVTA
jgi:hypothetical protein